jgi:MFS family permease
MLSAPFAGGIGIFAFYAMQPYLLKLYGGPESYAIAGIAAAIVAGAQIIGGLIVPYAGKIFHRRTTLLLVGSASSAVALALMGLCRFFGSCWSCLQCGRSYLPLPARSDNRMSTA